MDKRTHMNIANIACNTIMMRKSSLVNIVHCLFIVTIIKWADYTSASPLSHNDLVANRSYPITSDINDGNRYFSDEAESDEYEDDLDVRSNGQRQQEQTHDWDMLIFTQQWPVTTCYHWREEDKTHGCALPEKKEFWTIHGIWPTKMGSFGPSFCNKSADFNLDQLKEIEDRLKQFWPEIDSEKTFDSLWQHEWLKHGTCAALLEELDDELKYFDQGLNWRNKYLMSNILGSAGIHPDSQNTVSALHHALYKTLDKNPSIHCLYDSKNDVSYLSEIRICFDKTLTLIDCDGVKHGDAVTFYYPGGPVITNCPISKPVHYPSNVPKKWEFPIVNFYKLLQFVMWFTL